MPACSWANRVPVRPKPAAVDFVGDQVHLIAVAQGTGLTQILGVVHEHAAGALHQRFDDQGGNRVVSGFQHCGQCRRRALGDIGGSFARCGLAGLG